ILALGLDPKFADYSKMAGLTPQVVQSFIDAQLDRLRAAGFAVTSCLVDAGDTAESVAAAALAKADFDGVVIGAGLRDSSQLLLFEKILNLVHARAPRARLCFNSSPGDTLESVQRWVRA